MQHSCTKSEQVRNMEVCTQSVPGVVSRTPLWPLPWASAKPSGHNAGPYRAMGYHQETSGRQTDLLICGIVDLCAQIKAALRVDGS